MKPFKDRLADGEAAAFELLYEQCSGGLFRFLVSKTGSDHLAADVLQETFIRAVRFRDRLRDVRLIDYWYAVSGRGIPIWLAYLMGTKLLLGQRPNWTIVTRSKRPSPN